MFLLPLFFFFYFPQSHVAMSLGWGRVGRHPPDDNIVFQPSLKYLIRILLHRPHLEQQKDILLHAFQRCRLRGGRHMQQLPASRPDRLVDDVSARTWTWSLGALTLGLGPVSVNESRPESFFFHRNLTLQEAQNSVRPCNSLASHWVLKG